jgi:hypothetical protein
VLAAGLKSFIRCPCAIVLLGVCAGVDERWERLGRLKPEQKLDICIDMTDACVCICADGIRAQYPGISEEELVAKLRERLKWSKRRQKREG